MFRTLSLSIVMALLLISCDGYNPSIALLGPFSISQSHHATVGKPLNIPFFTMMMFSGNKLTADFHRDSILISPIVPQGWEVQSVELALVYDNLDSYMKFLENAENEKLIEQLINKTPEDRKGFVVDSIISTYFIGLLPKLSRAERVKDYDAFLTTLLDTGRTVRQFQSFRIHLPINIAATQINPSVTIVGNIRILPTTPGRHNVGFFMSMDAVSAWKQYQDTSMRPDTVLTCYADYDTVTVSGTSITLMAPDVDETDPFFLSSTPNPMDAQGGVISFIMKGKAAELSLYDISGRPIFSEPISGQYGIRKYLISRFTKRPLIAGQYILNLEMDGKRLSKPITVLR